MAFISRPAHQSTEAAAQLTDAQRAELAKNTAVAMAIREQLGSAAVVLSDSYRPGALAEAYRQYRLGVDSGAIAEAEAASSRTATVSELAYRAIQLAEESRAA